MLDALARVRDRPPPADRFSGGCAVAIVAIIAIVLMPFLGRAFDLPGVVMGAAGATLVLVALFGGLLGIFGGGAARDAPSAEVESAVADVIDAYREGDADRLREAAVVILERAYRPMGSRTERSFDREEVGKRLGSALPYVVGIERILVELDEIDPVFTARPSPG